jgi:hypothetical protein
LGRCDHKNSSVKLRMVYAFRDDVMTILLRFAAGARRSSNPIMHPQRKVFLAEL